MNEVVIRGSEEQEEELGRPEREREETKEILKKANSAQGRRVLRLQRDTGSYYMRS